MDLALGGAKAIVTGGSKGLGRAIARELASEGADIAICARHENELQESAAYLRETGRLVHAQVADVTDAAQVGDFVARSAAALGGLDILINNAGAAHPGTFETLTDDDWRADFDLKLMSMIRCSREAIPHFRARESGRIVNINAIYGKSPHPTFFASSVNRAACLSFTKALSMELAPYNVLVNSVNIGFVATPQWKSIHQRRAPNRTEEDFFREIVRDEVPLQRFGTPEEVAGVVAFLASRRASYITGASIDVGGGMGRYL